MFKIRPFFMIKEDVEVLGDEFSQHYILRTWKVWGLSFWNLYLNVLISKGRPRNNDLWNWFSLDLGVQMRWYLDWGSFRAWKTFSKILVNRCWLNIDIEASVGKKLVKNRQKGNCWPKRWGVFAILVLGSWYSGEK